MKRIAILTLVLGGLLPAFGQFGREVSRRASIRGGGGEWGKCTIEVEVDHLAEPDRRAVRAGQVPGLPGAHRLSPPGPPDHGEGNDLSCLAALGHRSHLRHHD